MSESLRDYYTAREVGDLLGYDRQTVYALIRTGVLPTQKVHGAYHVPSQAVADFQKAAERRVTSRSRVVIARRLFLKGAGAVALTFVTQGFYDAAKTTWGGRAQAMSATELVQELFGSIASPGGRSFDFSIGRPKYRGRHPYHVDNWAAGVALTGPLGLPGLKNLVHRQDSGRMDLSGDLVIVGGSTSTDETMIAWELEGPNDQELSRPADPILPLRWYDIADVNHPSILNSDPIGYVYEGWGPRSSAAWPIQEIDLATGKPSKLWMPETGSETVTIKDVRFPVPHDNYLCVTRLPNFLSTEFDAAGTSGRWPHLLVISGGNGIGTRAAGLLTSSAGVEALRDAEVALGGAREFQVLFRAHGLQRAGGGFHRLQRIEFVAAQPLDLIISAERYRLAHERAMRQLQERLPRWVPDEERKPEYL